VAALIGQKLLAYRNEWFMHQNAIILKVCGIKTIMKKTTLA
jgi:hypothetical protein